MSTIPNEIAISRRENGLSVRFLAQSLINDTVFPEQQGIRLLLSKACNGIGSPRLTVSGSLGAILTLFCWASSTGASASSVRRQRSGRFGAQETFDFIGIFIFANQAFM